MLSILPFFSLNPKPLNIISCFCLHSSYINIFCYIHQLLISSASFINFDRTNVYSRYEDSKIFLHPLFYNIFCFIIYKGYFTF